MAADETPVRPDLGQIWEWRGTERPRLRFRIESTEPDAVTLIPLDPGSRSFVRVGRRTLAAEYQLVADVQPDVAPAPDGDAGGADPYLAPARAWVDYLAAKMDPAVPDELMEGFALPRAETKAQQPSHRIVVDAARAPLLVDIDRLQDLLRDVRTYGNVPRSIRDRITMEVGSG